MKQNKKSGRASAFQTGAIGKVSAKKRHKEAYLPTEKYIEQKGGAKMKAIKKLRRYVIVSLSQRDKEQHNTDSDYACILKDEMELPANLRELDMECGSLQEAIDFVG